MNFRKSFGLALALTLLLSSCSSSTEEATIDTGILERLNAATGYSWGILPLYIYPPEFKDELYRYGYIQELRPSDPGGCMFRVYVFESDEYAKKAKDEIFIGDLWGTPNGFIGVIDDPLSDFGIILEEAGYPCSVAAASTFDFALPRKK